MKISLSDKKLNYCGRIDDREPERPVFIYPATSMEFSFHGKSAVLYVSSKRICWKNFVGAIVDGVQKKWEVSEEGITKIELIREERERKHHILFFKRMDCCHELTLEALELSEGARLLDPPPRPERRIEVYGDSVSAGEVSEALDYVGRPDPVHEGQFSNSWYSYAWMTARKLHAEIHDIAQGGIPVVNGTGWVDPPVYPGMEYLWDKLHYHPQLGYGDETISADESAPFLTEEERKAAMYWDFSRYTPQVVILAVGQNDSNPEDYMRKDPAGEKAEHFRETYRKLVENTRGKYPKALIVLSTTILEHDRAWDDAIETVYQELKKEDPLIRHFVYTKNGVGTPGHIRIPEAEEMSEELAAYIEKVNRELPEPFWPEEAVSEEKKRDCIQMEEKFPDNQARLKACIQKAERGEELTLAFFGGSITQGSLATAPENTYACRVFRWWQERFPKAKLHYVNGGIGGTTSHFGVARAAEDLLMYEPDFVVVDFSVNDDENQPEFFSETYEGLLRRILSWPSEPGVVVLNNVFYDTGVNCQDFHNRIADYYGVPHVSIRDSIYQRMKNGEFTREELTPDGLHPNDKGHGLVAEEICRYLEMLLEDVDKGAEDGACEPEGDLSAEVDCMNGEQVVKVIRNECAENGCLSRKQVVNVIGNEQIESGSAVEKGIICAVEDECTEDGCANGEWIINAAGNGCAEKADRLRREGLYTKGSQSAGFAEAAMAVSGQLTGRLPAPLTQNSYEHAVRLTIRNCRPALFGFRADPEEKRGHLDCFKNGWTAENSGDRICFEVEASCIAIQYRKSIRRPAPVARAIVDGDLANATILDANFEENWGDCLYLVPVLHHSAPGFHTVEIEIIEAPSAELREKSGSGFYLLSLITA